MSFPPQSFRVRIWNLGSIRCKHIVRWDHLSQVKARLFWLVVNVFFQRKCSRLYLLKWRISITATSKPHWRKVVLGSGRAQLVERMLLTQEIRGSNPDIGKIVSTNCTIRKTKIEAGNGPSLKKWAVLKRSTCSRLRRVRLPRPLPDGDDDPDVRPRTPDLLRVLVQPVRLHRRPGEHL